MERLTGRCTDGTATPIKHLCAKTDLEILDRLAAYEDIGTIDHLRELVQAEKDGRLVVLPCRVGDTVWANISIHGDRYRRSDRPYPVKVVFVGIGDGSSYFHVQYTNGRVFPLDFDQVGKTVFLTREEAEEALKGGVE